MRNARIGQRALLVVALATASLGGCATEIGPSSSELKANWDAQNVFPERYRQDLLAFLHTYLNDPSHIRDAGGIATAAEIYRPRGPLRRMRALQRTQYRRKISRVERRRGDICLRQARSFPRYAEGSSRALQGCRFCAVPRTGKTHALARRAHFTRHGRVTKRKHAPAPGLNQLGGARFRQNGRK